MQMIFIVFICIFLSLTIIYTVIKEVIGLMENKSERLSDRAFLRLISASITSIILCMVCLASTTWAWFSESIYVDSTKIVAAHGTVSVKSVVGPDGALSDAEIDQLISKQGLDLRSGTYVITIERNSGSSSGYFVLLWNQNKYYAEGLIRDSENDTDLLASYVIEIPDGVPDQRVTVDLRWGIYSGEPVIKRMVETSDGGFDVTPFRLPVTEVDMPID